MKNTFATVEYAGDDFFVATVPSGHAQVIDFKSGQTLTFKRDPAVGVNVDINGKGGSTIEGADFASALLAIWLGAKPPNDDLKTGLLGGACD